MSISRPVVFLGRADELRALSKARAAARAGSGQIAIVSGEPGIGKTRLVEEGTNAAKTEGFQIARGYCREPEGTPPYWPWIEVFGDVSGWADDQAAVGKSILEQLRAAGEPDVSSANGFAYKLAARSAAAIGEASRRSPVMLVLEDLHWSDGGSLLLLELLVDRLRDSRTLIVSTIRSADPRDTPAHDFSFRILRRPGASQISLTQLDSGSIVAAMQNVADILDPGVARRIQEVSQGNPFFAIELARLWSSGRPHATGIPASIKWTVGRRLQSVNPECVQLLELACVLGMEFGARELSELAVRMGRSPDVRALDEAIRVGLLEKVPGFNDLFRFHHAITREAVLDSLGPVQLSAVHAAVAEVLETSLGRDAVEESERLTFHLESAGTLGDPVRLATYALEAGRRAQRANALETAAQRFSLTLKLKVDTRDPEWTEASHRLGRVLLALGIGDPASERAAFNHIRAAFDHLVEGGQFAAAVEVASGYLPPRVWVIDEILLLVEDAMSLVAAGSAEEGHLLARRGYALACGTRRDYRAGLRDLERSAAIAESLDNGAIRARSLQSRALVEIEFHNWGRARDTAVELARPLAGASASMRASGYRGAVTSMLALGQTDEARRCMRSLGELARSSDDLDALRGFEAARYDMAMLTGDHHLIDDMVGDGSGALIRSMWTPVQFAHYQLLWGDPTAAARLLDDLMVNAPAPHARETLRAQVRWILARASHISLDAKYAAAAAKIEVRPSPMMSGRARSWANADGLLAWATTDPESAATVLQKQQRFSGEADSGNRGEPCVIDGVLALAAETAGHTEVAETHFNKGLVLCRAAGFETDRFLISRDWALALISRSGPDRRDEIGALIAEAREVAARIGLNSGSTGLDVLNDQYARWLERCQTTSAVNLTPRELDVLRLIARGQTNRQIARELNLSTHTVGEYVSNILMKTGSSNRAGAAVFAERSRLL